MADNNDFRVKDVTGKQIGGIELYRWIGWLITLAVIVAAAYMGVDLPDLPDPPDVDGDEVIGARSYSNFSGLVVAGPTETFTDYELFQIDQFLMQGKNLALFVDSFNEVMPGQNQQMQFNRGPSYVPLKTGLEKLMRHYGISVKKSYVLDENCYKQQVPAQFGGGERQIYFAPLIKNEFIRSPVH